MYLMIRNKIINLICLSKYTGLFNALRFPLTKRLILCKIANSSSFWIRGRSSDFATLRQVFEDRHYDYPELPENPKVIVDLGANIGLATIFFRQRYPSASIISLEPSRDNFDILRVNTKADSRIQILQKAIGPMNGFVKLCNPNAKADSFRFEPVDREYEGVVETWSMPTLMRELSIETVDILKIDIEGAEMQLFLGNRDWLRMVRSILIEVHEAIVPGVSKLIQEIADEHQFSMFSFGEGYVLISKGAKHGQ